MNDDRDKKVTKDEYGNEWLIGEDGKHILDERGDKIPPTYTSKVTSKPGEFTIYDSSQGHCGLCGSLRCSGSCFR